MDSRVLMSFLKKKILDFSGDALGLDLSDLSVKVVKLAEDGKKQKVVSCGSAPIAQGSVIDGEIMRKENVIEAIKKAGRERRSEKNKDQKSDLFSSGSQGLFQPNNHS